MKDKIGGDLDLKNMKFRYLSILKNEDFIFIDKILFSFQFNDYKTPQNILHTFSCSEIGSSFSAAIFAIDREFV